MVLTKVRALCLESALAVQLCELIGVILNIFVFLLRREGLEHGLKVRISSFFFLVQNFII